MTGLYLLASFVGFVGLSYIFLVQIREYKQTVDKDDRRIKGFNLTIGAGVWLVVLVMIVVRLVS